MHPHSELPSLRATVRLEGKNIINQTQWYDVKFYPYTAPGVDPIFAATGGRFTIICRCVLESNNSVEVLRLFKDEQVENPDGEPFCFNSLEWSQAENGDPLVCVSGNMSQIKVLNVITGELVTTLIGHGSHINDLAMSRINPSILASASIDHSVRIWSLNPAHKKQPTAAICFGQGHKDQVLTLAYHRKGRYVLSGGMDTRVNLWMVPDNLEERMGTDKPAMIHYPHFSTTEIHTDFVDCVHFFGDVIISHAAREYIILMWRIDGFNSDRDPPGPAPIPPSQAVNSHSKVSVPTSSISGTRSAWGGRFQRLLQFDLPDHNQFYIRFNIFHAIGAHPILVAGNENSKLFFWDLQRLEDAGIGDDPSVSASSSAVQSTSSGHIGVATTKLGRGGKAAKAAKAANAAKITKIPKIPNRGIGDPFRSVEPHKEITIQGYTFVFRQMAWSPDGQWCVATGDVSLIHILHRWEDGVPPPEVGAGDGSVMERVVNPSLETA